MKTQVEKLDAALRKFAHTGTRQDRIAIDAILHPEKELNEHGKMERIVYEANYAVQQQTWR